MRLLTIPPAGPATPLLSLTAVSFDCEATTLDVKSSRILELGAVAVVNGEVRPNLHFASYVHGAGTIPEESVRIHGITLKELVGAPDFATAYKQFCVFYGRHVLLGYALDFDFQLLSQECARADLPWKPAMALDVRSLVRVLNPALPDHSLETVASWLGIDVVDRHRALGDATLTARVLLALVPRLRDRGIRTLGEAWGACENVEGRGQAITIREGMLGRSMARVDSFPYRHRISEVMKRPPAMIGPKVAIRRAIAIMVESKVSSLFVEPKEKNGPVGILTERDILRAIAAEHESALAVPVLRFATFPLVTARANDFVYVAMGFMRRLRIRHLGVIDEDGKLIGALTQRDLLRLRADEALALSGALADSASGAELASVWHKLAEAARALVEEDVDARDVAAIISGEVCALTARAAVMAETEIAAKQARPDGLNYAVMVLGSGGRGESLLALDQDNAMIFSCPDEAAAEAWLVQVAARMNAILDMVGVPLCKGGVMARNAQWRLSTSAWRHQVERWLSRTDPADILNADIFFDAVGVHGNVELVEDLRNEAIAAAAGSEAFLKLMSLAAADSGTAFNWMGGFRTDEKGRIDMKRLGVLPIFSAARTSALRYRIHERSTRGRLAALRGNLAVPQRQLEALSEAHSLLMAAILRQQLSDIESGIAPSSNVDPKALSALEQSRLKWALQQVKSIPDLLDVPTV
jgi:CBS domain-containing protein